MQCRKCPTKQELIPCPIVLGSSAPYNNNTSLPNMPSEELCRWGPQCPICAQSTPNLKTEDSDWEEEDWNGDIQKAKEEEKQKKGNKLRRKLIGGQCTDNYYVPGPQYRLSYGENPLNILNGPSCHYKTKAEGEWRERLELLNNKYNLDYYSESDSESEHEYKTLV